MPLYASRGFSAFYLGDEAIIDCRTFSLEGARARSLRRRCAGSGAATASR